MAYTLSQGLNTEGLDRVQRGLLVGLPAIVVFLTIGTLLHHANVNNPATGAKTIPIVSTLKTSSGNSSESAASSNGIAAGTSAQSAGSGSLDSGSPAATSTSAGSGNTGNVVGGRGGGPAPLSATVTVPPVDLQAASKQLVSTPGTTVTVDP